MLMQTKPVILHTEFLLDTCQIIMFPRVNNSLITLEFLSLKYPLQLSGLAVETNEDFLL